MSMRLTRNEQILGEMAAKNEKLRIPIPGAKQYLEGFLSHVDYENHNKLIIDLSNADVFSSQQLESLRAGSDIQVNGSSQGVKVSFKAKVVKYQFAGERSSLVLKPDKLKYHDRRQAFRATTIESDGVHATVKFQEKTLKGEIHDISLTGMCLCFGEDIADLCKVSDLIAVSVSGLEEDSQFDCTIEVRRIFSDKNSESENMLGVQFDRLEKSQEQLLSRFIMTVQRSQLRGER